MEKKKTRVIAVVNEKGGVGKTAVAVNLAAALSEMDKDVLVVDVDPQFNATRSLGVVPAEGAVTTYELMTAEDAPDPAKAVMPTAWPRLFCIPSCVDLAGAEVELVNEKGRENKLQVLSPLVGKFDFIFLDTPPSLSLLTVNVFAFAREVLIPCQTQAHAYAALDDLLDTIALVQGEINGRLSVTGVVPTFFNRRTRVSRGIMERLQQDKRFAGKVFDTAIRANSTIAESEMHAKPVVFYRRSSPGAEDFRSLAAELLQRR